MVENGNHSHTVMFDVDFSVTLTIDISLTLFGPPREKTCLPGFANNKGTDQPAQTDQHLYYSLFIMYLI